MIQCSPPRRRNLCSEEPSVNYWLCREWLRHFDQLQNESTTAMSQPTPFISTRGTQLSASDPSVTTIFVATPSTNQFCPPSLRNAHALKSTLDASRPEKKECQIESNYLRTNSFLQLAGSFLNIPYELVKRTLLLQWNCNKVISKLHVFWCISYLAVLITSQNSRSLIPSLTYPNIQPRLRSDSGANTSPRTLCWSDGSLRKIVRSIPSCRQRTQRGRPRPPSKYCRSQKQRKCKN